MNMPFDESLYVTANFTTPKGKKLAKQSNALTINDTSNIESTLELREGTMWYMDANLTTPVGYSTNRRDTYCVFDLKNVKGGEVLELTGHPVTLTVFTIDVTLLSDSSKLTSPIGFNTLYALYKSPDRGNIPMRTIPITIPRGITGNVRLVFKSSAYTLHHSMDRGSSVFDFILKHNNVQIGVIKTAYRS